MIKTFLVDDEPLALERLRRMLQATGRVEIAGACTDPVEAVEQIRWSKPQLLFLDIHMPELTGFELLAELEQQQPLAVFTTAYNQHALEAFQVNSIDYLMKPIEPAHLERALAKAERMFAQAASASAPPDLRELLAQLRPAIKAGAASAAPRWIERIASRTGDKLELVDLSRVTHFYASDKLTYAATAERSYAVDPSITDLESKLDPARFVRIHRATILNLDHLRELHTWFGGKMVARLKDTKKTELAVSRDRARVLKGRLGV
ncbi:MAG: LytTR family DNA-binding domain-containing protein [Acidobacteriota bacterium]